MSTPCLACSLLSFSFACAAHAATPGSPLQQYEHTSWISGVEVWNWDNISFAEKIFSITYNNEVVCIKIQLCHVFCVFFIGLAHPHLSDRRWDVLWKDYGGTDVMCVHPVVSNIAWKWLTVTRKELRNFSLLNFFLFLFFFFLKMYLNSFSSSWAKEFKCLSDHWVDLSWHFRAWCGMLMAPNSFMAPFVTSCLL